jgi:hypothetical protein
MSFKTSSRTATGCGLGIAVALCAMTSARPSPVSAQPAHYCASAASEQAQKLLAFHFGPDGRIEIDKSVKVLAPIRNPANRAQRLDVLEVWGHIYKGQYRMRFIYARSPKECVLIGQEVLEYASL